MNAAKKIEMIMSIYSVLIYRFCSKWLYHWLAILNICVLVVEENDPNFHLVIFSSYCLQVFIIILSWKKDTLHDEFSWIKLRKNIRLHAKTVYCGLWLWKQNLFVVMFKWYYWKVKKRCKNENGLKIFLCFLGYVFILQLKTSFFILRSCTRCN